MDKYKKKYLTLKLLKNTLMCNFRIYFTFSLELLIVKYCKKKTIKKNKLGKTVRCNVLLCEILIITNNIYFYEI